MLYIRVHKVRLKLNINLYFNRIRIADHASSLERNCFLLKQDSRIQHSCAKLIIFCRARVAECISLLGILAKYEVLRTLKT